MTGGRFSSRRRTRSDLPDREDHHGPCPAGRSDEKALRRVDGRPPFRVEVKPLHRNAPMGGSFHVERVAGSGGLTIDDGRGKGDRGRRLAHANG